MTRISLIRHGDASYTDTGHKKTFEGAKDIKEESIDKLKNQAKTFANKLSPDEEIVIWSSPIPRCLETANIFEEEINKRGITITHKKIFKVFEEVKGFRWEYLQKMVDGGDLVIDGKTYKIDKSKTNPENLSYGKYFRLSYYKKIDPSYLASIGKAGETLNNIESYASVFRRIFRELERLSKLKKSKKHILLNTHQCNTDFIVEVMNGYESGGIATGENITLETDGVDFNVIDFPQEYRNENSLKLISSTKNKVKDLFEE